MFANPKALLVIVSCALVAHAQSASGSSTTSASGSQTTPGGIDACILSCVTQALPAGNCSSPTDLTCVCTSTAFQQAALACLQANCTPADLQTAEALQQQECASLGSGASSAPASTGAASSVSSASASASPSVAPSAAPSASHASTPASASGSATHASASAPSSASATGSATPSATQSSAAMVLSTPFSLGSFFGTLVASAGALVGAAFVL